MRDASSYDDIIQINYEENVFDESTYGVLRQLVTLRKPLVQDYYTWQRNVLNPLVQPCRMCLNSSPAR